MNWTMIIRSSWILFLIFTALAATIMALIRGQISPLAVLVHEVFMLSSLWYLIDRSLGRIAQAGPNTIHQGSPWEQKLLADILFGGLFFLCALLLLNGSLDFSPAA